MEFVPRKRREGLKDSLNISLLFFGLQVSGSGHYRCLAENEHGIASSNTVFLRESSLDNFDALPPMTKTVIEGYPLKLPCKAPHGWPEPSVHWMIHVIITQNVK